MIIGTVHSKSVGKTTLAVHMAAWLDLYGYSVVVVDADWQQQSSDWLDEAAPQIQTRVIQEPVELSRTVPELLEEFQVVIVDGPAGLNATAGAVLGVSDAVLVPCGPGASEIKALKMVADTIKEAQRIRQENEGQIKPGAFIIPVRTSPRWNATKVLLEEAKKLGFIAMPAQVPFRQIYANLAGMPGQPPRLLWQVGRSKEVKSAVMDLDGLFQSMFPEASEHDPKLMAKLMSEPMPRNRTRAKVREEDEQEGIVANS